MDSCVEGVLMKRTRLQIGQLSAAEVPVSHGRMQSLQKRCPQTRRIGSWISSQQVGQSSLAACPSSVLFGSAVSTCRFARWVFLLGKCFLFSDDPEGGKTECQRITPSMKAAACSFVFDMHTTAKMAGATSDQAETSMAA